MSTSFAAEVVASGLVLDGAIAAPTVAEIIANPKRMERCAAAMMYVFAAAQTPPTSEDLEWSKVEKVSEADTLHNLASFVAESDIHDRPEDREFVAQLPQATFIDAEAMTDGARAIARRWAELLDTLPSLHVMVDQGKSAIVVFDRVM